MESRRIAKVIHFVKSALKTEKEPHAPMNHVSVHKSPRPDTSSKADLLLSTALQSMSKHAIYLSGRDGLSRETICFSLTEKLTTNRICGIDLKNWWNKNEPQST